MKKLFLLFIFSSFSLVSYSQLRFGARFSVGAYFGLFDLDILAPYDNGSLVGPTVSEFGNPIPRSKKETYVDFAQQYEVFLASKKSIYKFGVSLVRSPRQYDDRLELFWTKRKIIGMYSTA